MIGRLGPSVALMGADGAGKSTVSAAVMDRVAVPARTIYMGLYREGSRRRRRHVPGLGLAAAVARQWGRWSLAQYHRARGRLVLFDRYTYDALLPPAHPLGRLASLRRAVLARACPQPSLVIVLDAPAEVLHARSGEHDVATLERHRQGLLALRGRVRNVLVVDAQQDTEAVVGDVLGAIGRLQEPPGS